MRKKSVNIYFPLEAEFQRELDILLQKYPSPMNRLLSSRRNLATAVHPGSTTVQPLTDVHHSQHQQSHKSQPPGFLHGLQPIVDVGKTTEESPPQTTDKRLQNNSTPNNQKTGKSLIVQCNTVYPTHRHGSTDIVILVPFISTFNTFYHSLSDNAGQPTFFAGP